MRAAELFALCSLDLPDPRLTPAEWWSQTGSNRRPPACKAGALPTELWPHQTTTASARRSGRRPRSRQHLPATAGIPTPDLLIDFLSDLQRGLDPWNGGPGKI